MKIKARHWFIGAIAIPALGVAWLIGTQRFAAGLDKITTQQLARDSLTEFGWNGTYLRASSHALDLQRVQGSPLNVEIVNGAALDVGQDRRLVLKQGGERIVLGRQTERTVPDQFRPYQIFALESGDRLSYETARSWLDWPNFFEMNFVTGYVPTWTRYRHYRLTWQKPSGLSIELNWRFEQFYDSQNGWVDADMTDGNLPCGLIRMTVQPGAAQMR